MNGDVVERIYEYDNYRFFLRDYFREQKRLKEMFSHRYFARRAGFASSSFCAHVIEGKRNLTESSLGKMVRGLKLTGKASSYFATLVAFNQARTVEERERTFRTLERLRKSTDLYRLNRKQWAYYDEWYYPVIRELAVYADWQGDYRKLGALVRPVVSPEKARQAVETLVAIGMLRPLGEGRYEQPSEGVTASDVPSAVTRSTRKEFLLRAIEAAETLPVDERHVSGVTVAMSRGRYEAFVEKMDELRRMVLAAAIEEPEVERVYQFNFQAFPLSEPVDRPGRGKRGIGGRP
jgi:uncharacterized protein (TIGR02147 family)